MLCAQQLLKSHVTRWGYKSIAETREQVIKMREANIPLESRSHSYCDGCVFLTFSFLPTVMGNDIDIYHAKRDFTFDPAGFPGDEMRTFIGELVRPLRYFEKQRMTCS
jgi:alpha-glucosidase